MTPYRLQMLFDFGMKRGGIFLGKLEIVLRDFGFMTTEDGTR